MEVCETVISLDPLKVAEQPSSNTMHEVIGQFTESELPKNVSGAQVVLPNVGEIPSDDTLDEQSSMTGVFVPAESVFTQMSADQVIDHPSKL